MWDTAAIVLKYLWFIVIPIGLIGLALFKLRKASVLSQKGVSSTEANAAYWMIAVSIVVTAGGIGLAQLMGGINNPSFLYSGNWGNGYVVAGKVVLGLFWIGLLLWAWSSPQFMTYAKLILPRKASVLLPLAKPFASLVAAIGLSLLVFYQGNRVPFAVLNRSPQPLDWVAILHDDNRYRIDEIPQQEPTLHNIPLNGSSAFKIQYRLADSDKTWEADIPFTISEFSMGFVQLEFSRDGKLRVTDHRLLR